ncbi:hypothetical protein ACFSTH_16795 [Paenibacillus yanchengensis]|uniref:DUF3221 domain-containing protein n=1 Tax=Paenibacillus yanchengensis TaxID=2035833 RepID=A0ABW4YPR8_9BACL
MKIIHVMIVFCLIAVGCSKVDNIDQIGTDQVGGISISGYVVKKEEGQFLLVSPQVSFNNDYEANWVVSNEVVELGQLIEVLVVNGEINASDPGKVTAESITILEDTPHHGAKNAIEYALLQHHYMDVPIIKTITYSKDKKEWLVVLVDKKDGDKREVSVTLKE